MRKCTQGIQRFWSKLCCLFLTATILLACVPHASAATPSSSANASATLAYTLKGLPLGRAVQNFYIGETYIYITQRVDAITYLSRLEIIGNEAHYKDRMTFENCGHGQSLDFYTYNGKEYFYMGCKSNDDYPDYYWSLQIARVQYKPDTTYTYTDLNRTSYMNYANASATKLGTTYRVACCVVGDYTVFRIQTKEPSAVTYSAYNTTKLNKLLDASKSVDMRTATAACSFSFTQTGDGIIRPNDSFQGIDMSSKSSIYLSGGAEGQTPQIARMTSGGSYKKLISVTNVGTHEIEGVQCDRGRLYFLIVPETTSAGKKNGQQIWYLKETTFGITHTLTEIAGTAATCTSTGISNGSKCTTCGFLQDVQEVIPAKGHTSAKLPAVAATCTQTGLTQGAYCSVCNVTLTAQKTVPALGHNYNSGEITQAATCTQTGVVTYTCVTCNDSYTDSIDTLEHNYEAVVTAPTCTEVGYTTYTCACGESYTADETDALGHAEMIDEAVNPTCTETGLTEGKHCSVCNEVLVAQEVVEALGHRYEAVVTAPTCMSAGYTTYTCSVCGDTYKDNETEASGHNYDDGIITKQPTCTEEGVKTFTCTCGASYTEAVSALGHTEVTDEAVAPTCTEAGLTEGKHCSVCGEVTLAQIEVEPLGHSEETVTLDPTCTEEGSITVSCTMCNEVLSTTAIPANGHSMEMMAEKAATCTEDGYSMHYYCEDCDTYFVDEAGVYPLPLQYFVTPALGHKVEFRDEVHATCEQSGTLEHYYCKRCERNFFDAECQYEAPLEYLTVVPIGHDYKATVTAPTCTEAGYTTYTCTCGDNYTADEVDALGHAYTYTNNGENHIVGCENCDLAENADHNYVDGSCVCGAVEVTEPVLKPDSNLAFSMSITVGAEMQVVYTVLASKVSSYESFYLEVSKNVVGGDPVVTTYGLGEDMTQIQVLTNTSGKVTGYRATYTGINAKEMGDEFTATLYAVAADGTIYYSNANTNSIKSFLMGKITDTVSPATLKTLAVDMLNYGAAAQLNFSYDAENLVNADLTDEQKALGTQTLPEAVDSTVITGDGINLTASVTVKSKVELTLTCMYKTADASNVKFVFKDKDGKVLAELAPSNHIANKAVQCVYDQVGAKQMRQLITIEVYDGDTLVSKTLTWSIESYVASTLAKTSTSEILANMVNAMLIYGDSAAIYLKSTGQ